MPSIAFIGLVQNIEHLVGRLQPFLSDIAGSGYEAFCLCGENGSSDETRRALLSERNVNLEVMDTWFMAAMPDRMKRMAFGREAMKNAICRNQAVFDYVCVVDWDIVLISPPTARTFSEAVQQLASRPDLFAVAATSRPTYYDILSFEDETRSHAGLLRDLDPGERNPVAYYSRYAEITRAALQELTSADEILAISAFNGMCIYKRADFEAESYIRANAFDRSEHLHFNHRIVEKTGRRIAILPGLCLDAPFAPKRKSFAELIPLQFADADQSPGERLSDVDLAGR